MSKPEDKDEEDDVIVSSTKEKYVARTGASLGYKKHRRSSRGILNAFVIKCNKKCKQTKLQTSTI